MSDWKDWLELVVVLAPFALIPVVLFLGWRDHRHQQPLDDQRRFGGRW